MHAKHFATNETKKAQNERAKTKRSKQTQKRNPMSLHIVYDLIA